MRNVFSSARPSAPMLSRRTFLLCASSAAILTGLPAETAPNKIRRLSVGLCAPTYYNGFSPFLNWWKQAAPLQVNLKSGQTLSGKNLWNQTSYLDPDTGDLKSVETSDVESISRVFFTSTNGFQRDLGCDYSGEEFAVVWDGKADVSIDFLTAGSVQKPSGSNKIIFKMGSFPGNTSVTFKVIDRSTPPSNIVIYQTRYAQNVENGEIFNPDWIAAIRQFGNVRCMDWLAVNNSRVTDFSQLADFDYASWGQPYQSETTNDEHGPKGSMHPSILCELANRAQIDLHVCIPHRASDEFVASFARYFKTNTRAEVTYEFSNECWNGGFLQANEMRERGNIFWRDDPLRGHKYYGYRAAECMKIIRDVYRENRNWRGALATQTVNIGVTRAILSGVEHWRALHPGRSRETTVSSLFKSIYVTGYFGDVTTCSQPTSISKANPAVVTSPQHGYESGKSVRCFVGSGMTQLDGRDVTVQKIDDDTYSIDIDTSDYATYINDSKNYIAPADLFRLMDLSQSKHDSDPDRWPDRYLYFNQQVSLSCLKGECDFGISTKVSVESLKNEFWPAQLALAKANRLTLRQYEGGCHLVGDGYLTGYGGNERYTDFMLHHGHSMEIAAVYKDMYEGFVAAGGQLPSKYLADGPVSRFGSWAGVRYWPTLANGNTKDTGNPVWRETVVANRSLAKS